MSTDSAPPSADVAGPPTRWLGMLRTWAEMIKFEHSLFALPFALLATFLAGQHRATGWPAASDPANTADAAITRAMNRQPVRKMLRVYFVTVFISVLLQFRSHSSIVLMVFSS